MQKRVWTEEQKQALKELDEIYESVAYPILTKWQDFGLLKKIFTNKQLEKIEDCYSHHNHFKYLVEESREHPPKLIENDMRGLELSKNFYIHLDKMLDSLQAYSQNVVTLPHFAEVFFKFEQIEQEYNRYISEVLDDVFEQMVENEKAEREKDEGTV